MRGIEYEELSIALNIIRDTQEKGALSRLSEKSGLSLPVICRIANREQKTINFKTWQKLHDAEPDLIPAPIINTGTVEQIKKEAIDNYPILDEILERTKEAMAKKYSYRVFLTVLRNDIDTALTIEKSGGVGVRKTG